MQKKKKRIAECYENYSMGRSEKKKKMAREGSIYWVHTLYYIFFLNNILEF